MRRAQNHYIKVRILVEKVKIIQRFWKRRYLYRQTKRRIQQKNLQRLEDFAKLQEKFREDWTLTKTKHRVEIHVCSLALDEHSKLSVDKLPQRQNAHLCRVFRAALDGLVDVICVTAC